MYRTTHQLPLVLILILMFSIPLQAQSKDTANEIAEITNLAQLGKESAQTKRPILLLMSQDYCPYCRMIKREILNPMVLSGSYVDKIIIREMMIDSLMDMNDFDGTMRDPALIAERYNIKVTPTMLFLGPDGTELTNKIVGINTPELFSFYVDKAIDQAVLKLTAE